MPDNNSETCCSCCGERKPRPYKDSYMMTAQILSIVGLLLVCTSPLTLCFTIPGMILLQIVWCRAMKKSGLITAGVFCSVAGALAVICGAVGVVKRCEGDTSSAADIASSGDCYTDIYGNTVCYCYFPWSAIMTLVGFPFLTGAAVCTLLFACGPRYQKFQGGDNANNNNPKGANATAKSEDDPEAGHVVAVPIVCAVKVNGQDAADKKKEKKPNNENISIMSTKSTETKRITTLPNGSIKTEIETVRPDGSRVITTTIEEPKEEDFSDVDI